MEQLEENKLIDEIVKLREEMGRLTKQYSFKRLFILGMLRGAGFLVGATALVIFGGFILNVFGFIPILDDIAKVIMDAFGQAKLQ